MTEDRSYYLFGPPEVCFNHVLDFWDESDLNSRLQPGWDQRYFSFFTDLQNI